MIVFLDFDGVVHPEGCISRDDLFCRLPLIEEVLREFPAVEIVISSAWRLEYREAVQAVMELRTHFSHEIAPRVVGVTPHHAVLTAKHAPDGLTSFTRHWECESWVRTHRSPGTRWMAMDDRAYLFRPFSDHLMAFDRNIAFTQAHQESLRAYLVAPTQDTPWPDPY